MARYRTTDFVSLPAPYAANTDVTYRSWPRQALEPINDEAKKISEYYNAHKGSGDLPDSPFVNGKLHLPLLGLPMWKLGESYKKIESNPNNGEPMILRALGHSVMGSYRQTHSSFTSDRWPEKDVLPVNEHARLIVDYMKQNPAGPFEHPAWDSERHCVNVPRGAEAA